MTFDPRWNLFDQIFDGDTKVTVDDTGSSEKISFLVNNIETLSSTESTLTLGKGTESKITITDDEVRIYAGTTPNQRATFDDNGFKLESGVAIIGFSDSTSLGTSDVLVPTQNAVKHYVDSQVTSIHTNEITQGDSFVRVTDTGTGNVEVNVDGNQKAYYTSTSARFTGDSGSFLLMNTSGSHISGANNVSILIDTNEEKYLDITDSDVKIGRTEGSWYLSLTSTNHNLYVNNSGSAVSVIQTSNTTQRFGRNDEGTTSYITTGTNGIVSLTGPQRVTATVNSQNLLDIQGNTQSIGLASDTNLVLNQSANTATIEVNNVDSFQIGVSEQRLGNTSGPRVIASTEEGNSVDLYASSNRIGYFGTSNIELGHSALGYWAQISYNTSIQFLNGTNAAFAEFTDSNITFNTDLTVNGDLFVDGTTWVVHNQEVTTSDNIIVVNDGETGNGVTAGSAGMEVDRGQATNYRFVFDEPTDTFRVGEIGDLQAVATREDSPGNKRVAWWNDTEKRFDTLGNTYLTIDATTNQEIEFFVNSSSVGKFTSSGFSLASGATVNDISDDSDLTDASHTALVTEYAVKQYVDSATGAVDRTKIIENNSYVEVIDNDATSRGVVTLVLDGTEFARFTNPSDNRDTQITIGEKTNSSYMEINGSSITFHVPGITGNGYFGISDNGIFVSYGIPINEFSIDGTLGGNSDTALPTEKAVKTYVDTALNSKTHNSLSGLQGGDSTNSEYYHLTQSIYENLYSDGTQTGLGSSTGTAITVDQDSDVAQATVDQVQVLKLTTDEQILGNTTQSYMTLDSTSIYFTLNSTVVGEFTTSGFKLESGSYINEFSTDGTLGGNSDTAVPTEKAVKTYVDTSLLDYLNLDVSTVTSDTTASDGDIILVDTSGGNVTIYLDVAADAYITVKKISSDSNTVTVQGTSGNIDGNANITFTTQYQSYSFASDGTNFFIV